ncbi:hypothetical protein A6V39_01175 [Candidatus Mycoplasma haematobovis]|uniref:Uncharacterized protein n=1 Tax=Candidatus Mycoplasma haematobovis TaxID=432608 RepID=A0A1A9QFB9_9MOLU|nr:hypothetical protein [Candidatus Mycoplasma haematobovis]OAL10665.1 hypothetical protein A6V39_01175 [Candidatus Mycoplasma haematobovis]
MTGPIKALIGGAVGATAIGGGATYFIINNQKQPTKVTDTPKEAQPAPKPSIVQSLSQDKELLNISGSDPKWNENWGTFKASYAGKYTTNSAWTFENWDTLQRDVNAPEAFKQKCQTNSGKPRENNDTLLQEVEKFCAKDKNKNPG